ncbi:hypothetical protein EDC18_105149 [Natranaerovirga pectinivora]|uniref:Uncharacterized protein n=1 Tax=Natranaerovirga pectinivora TaxID=682400 RepID=A0A4R3MLU5_9FIRM|nr:hypothetical protein [Natranaerovirga pectinivora]TCT14667.1 hypothetical protein EDC18_105149 [Natranaerovirga pectinivora]
MLSEEKIKIMTKLAIYEKNIGKEDFRINDYFKHDYILINNMKTRIGITIALMMLFGGHAVLELFVFVEERTNIDFIKLGITYGVLYLVLILVYSVLSTRIYSQRYKEAQARLSGYKKLIEKINKIKDE